MFTVQHDTKRCGYHITHKETQYFAACYGADESGEDFYQFEYDKGEYVSTTASDIARKGATVAFQDAFAKAISNIHLMSALEDTTPPEPVNPTMTFTFPWPNQMLSPNVVGHWAPKAKAKKAYRAACKRIVDETPMDALSLPPDATVRVLMRFYPPTRRHRDRDNLMASMKSGLDGLADGLGINDSLFRPEVELMDELGPKVVITVEIK